MRWCRIASKDEATRTIAVLMNEGKPSSYDRRQTPTQPGRSMLSQLVRQIGGVPSIRCRKD